VTPVIELAGIRVAHAGQAVLDVPHLIVRPGEMLAVIGPNGAGKSTLLRVMGLLQTPDAGGVKFQGETVTAAQGLNVRRRMASVFQDPLLADATVLANVAMGLRFRGVPRERIETQVARWLERLAIGGLAGRPSRTLSGGEAQRVASPAPSCSSPRSCCWTSRSPRSTSRRASSSSPIWGASFARST
jgi:ABC-type metal ion transport system, ATPase component